MTNEALINKFYTSFSKGDIENMIDCYHDDIIFEDPAFGELKGDAAKAMWRMLLSRGDGEMEIKHSDVIADGNSGSANWVATYNYGPKKRKVVNEISAKFNFKDGKIIDHRDDFNLWKWSSQALGLSGLLLGWTPIIKNKIQATTNKLLTAYMDK